MGCAAWNVGIRSESAPPAGAMLHSIVGGCVLQWYFRMAGRGTVKVFGPLVKCLNG